MDTLTTCPVCGRPGNCCTERDEGWAEVERLREALQEIANDRPSTVDDPDHGRRTPYERLRDIARFAVT